jgi:hypothetical protein
LRRGKEKGPNPEGLSSHIKMNFLRKELQGKQFSRDNVRLLDESL